LACFGQVHEVLGDEDAIEHHGYNAAEEEELILYLHE
jgi:hypothetical protein